MQKGLIALIMLLSMTSVAAAGDELTSGRVRPDGTYVAPYHRTTPDSAVTNNYGFKGNVNPYSGQVGTQRYPQAPTSPYYNPYATTNRSRVR